jgi:dihydrofolate reductase
MNVEAIMALDLLNGLAKNEKIPWKSKTDMIFFKNKTLENTVIMGSKTLLSLPKSKPLKNRTNIVITNEKEKYSKLYEDYTNCFFLNLEETLCIIKKERGNQIYKLLLPYCSGIWLTKIKQNYNCDLIFNTDITTYDKEIIYKDDELEIMYLN